MLQYYLFFLLSTTSVKANTGCTGDYQYERRPPASFNHCNPVRTSLQLGCTVLVPSGNTAVTVDWYWSKNISECGRNISEEQGRFTINTNRGSSHLLNIDRITTHLTITSPQTDTGYYWCQVNDPSYNGVFISSNKAPVFDTETMTICSGTQSILQSICAVGSISSLICVIPTFSSVQSIIANTTLSQPFTSSTTTILTGSCTITHIIDPTSPTNYNIITFITMDISPYTIYMTPSSDIISMTSSLHTCHNEGLISGLVVLSIIMFILGSVLSGLLTVLWSKRHNKDLKNPTNEEKQSIPKQQDVLVTEVNTAYGLTVFSQDTSVTDPPSDYLYVYDTPQQ